MPRIKRRRSYNPNDNNANSSKKGRKRWSQKADKPKRGSRRNRSKKQTIDPALYVNEQVTQTTEAKNTYVGSSYSSLQLQKKLQKNLSAKGFETMTEIQDKAIPLIMQGHNMLGISPTGSGKTGAFLIPIIQKMLTKGDQKLLVVAPTRELAMQIAQEAISCIKGTEIQVATVIGGQSMSRQLAQLKRGAHIIVGTPGRINDHVKRGTINLQTYNNIVVDEVDRMFDMGFIVDIKFIFTKLAEKKQILFFSATHNKQVEDIADTLCESYDIVKIAQNTPSKSVIQSVIDYSHSNEKIEILQDILNKEEVEKAIIFVDTKRFADKIDRILFKNKFKVGVIHGDKRQNFRKRMIDKFTRSDINVLVATNVAARGLDIDDITHVINLDEPQSYDEYIHRIGRTGRNGSHGVAYTFVKRNS